jgi:hypothetical protein
MKKPLWLFICFFILLLSRQYTIAQNQIPFSVIGSGGEKIASVSYVLNSTVGEAFIGKSINTSNQKYTGFWYAYEQSTITAVEQEQEIIPTEFKLEQNYPNPFNPSTIIKFAIPEKSSVVIKIYDILGAEVLTLVNEEMEAGWFQKEFNASGYSTGVYIYRIQASNYTSTKKMILVK